MFGTSPCAPVGGVAEIPGCAGQDEAERLDAPRGVAVHGAGVDFRRPPGAEPVVFGGVAAGLASTALFVGAACVGGAAAGVDENGTSRCAAYALGAGHRITA